MNLALSYLIGIIGIIVALGVGYKGQQLAEQVELQGMKIEEISKYHKSSANSMKEGKKDMSKKVVEDFIMENPEILIKSIENMQAMQQKERYDRMSDLIKAKIDKLENDKNTPFVGNKDAKVTIVEFFDYNCHYCKRVIEAKKRVLKKFKDVKFVMKDLPILGQSSGIAAKAGIAVYMIDPSKYLQYHFDVLSLDKSASEDMLMKLAIKNGIDAKKFEDMMRSKAINKIIKESMNLSMSIGIQGTPAYIIGGEFVPGGALSYEDFVEYIKEARKRLGVVPPNVKSDNSKDKMDKVKMHGRKDVMKQKHHSMKAGKVKEKMANSIKDKKIIRKKNQNTEAVKKSIEIPKLK